MRSEPLGGLDDPNTKFDGGAGVPNAIHCAATLLTNGLLPLIKVTDTDRTAWFLILPLLQLPNVTFPPRLSPKEGPTEADPKACDAWSQGAQRVATRSTHSPAFPCNPTRYAPFGHSALNAFPPEFPEGGKSVARTRTGRGSASPSAMNSVNRIGRRSD